MIRFLAKLGRDVKGATALEYGLILALLVIAMLGGASVLGGGVSGAWNKISNKITTA